MEKLLIFILFFALIQAGFILILGLRLAMTRKKMQDAELKRYISETRPVCRAALRKGKRERSIYGIINLWKNY